MCVRSSSGSRRRAWGCLVTPLLAAGLAGLAVTAGAAAVPEFARNAEWLEFHTRNFTVFTDAGTGAALDVGENLERFAAALGVINPGLRTVSPLPTTVYVFRNQAELDAYRPARSENLVAYFIGTEDHNLLVINGSPEGERRSGVVFHEFVHCFLSANFPAVPMWLNEGLAEYYSTCRLSRGRAEFGKPEMYVVEWMKGRAPISVGMMFAMTPSSPAYRKDNELRNQFYSQSFLLTHALQSPSGGRAERFDRFLARLHDGAVPLLAFREQFPESEWDPMVQGLSAYLDRIEFEDTRRVDVPAIPGSASDPRPVGVADAAIRLGELCLTLDREQSGAAAAHFQAALDADPGSATAQVFLGLARDLAGRTAEAEACYARALAAAPNDPRVPVLAARGTMRRLIRRNEESAPPETLVALAHQAREHYARGLKLDPGSIEALGGYGMTFALTAERADTATVAGLARAVGALPFRTDLAAALATLHALEGNTAGAQSLIEHRVMPGADPSDVKSLKQVLRDVDADRGYAAEERFVDRFNEGVVLAQSGHLEEARTRFVAVRDSTGQEALREKAEKLILRTDGEIRLRRARDLATAKKLREAEAVLSASEPWPEECQERAAKVLAEVRALLDVERAMRLIKAGKLPEARAAFAQVLTLDVSEEMKNYARVNIKQIDAAMPKR